MKFLHITDTHLGYHQYGLEERARDFFDVFEEAVELAIERKVDFVIHSGDFFHTSRPSNAVLLQGIELVRRLNDAKIPVFAIAGNHDRGNRVKDVSPLHILKDLGLKLIEQGTVEYEGIHISGLKYLSKIAVRKLRTIKPILERFLENGKNSYFHILMLHQEFQPVFPDGLFISREIPEDFDYVGIGHFHEKQEPFKYGRGYIVYPGSTEFTAYSKNEDKVPKGVFFIEREKDKTEIEFVELKNRRPFIQYEFKEDEIDFIAERIKRDLKEIKDRRRKAPVLILNCEIDNLSLKELSARLSKNGIVPDGENILYINFRLKRKETNKTSSVDISAREIDIKKELSSLINDEELVDRVIEIIENARAMESTDEFKKFLKENPKLLDI